MRKRYLHDYYGESDVFWDQNWDGDWVKKVSTPPPVTPQIVSHMMRYLRPDMLLLEGGCGDGRYVRYFSNLGVKTIGIDFAKNTVQQINELLPNLDVRVGNIRKLEFPDHYFDGYYSGGVIEHFEDGVAPQLDEAHRVLKMGGYFFVTVPHMNFIRRCAAIVFPTRTKLDLDGRNSFHRERLQEFRVEQPPDSFHFHEYTFTTREMRGFLKTHGFVVVEEWGFSVMFGLYDIEWYRKLVGADRINRTTINRILALPAWLARKIENSSSTLAHCMTNLAGMIVGNLKLYVCKKKNRNDS